jgi:hypothetical protein
MNGKQAKKIRQQFKREMQKTAQEMGRTMGNVLKPKPKWIPQFVWIFLLGFFIRIHK